MYRNLVADLADEPFIMLERHPVARPPAMIAMPRRIERNHPIADPQRAFGAPRLLDAIGGAIGRTAARVGPIGIGRMKGFEIDRKRVVEGKGGSGSVDLGGRQMIHKKKSIKNQDRQKEV